jgi:putative endonuclease
LRNHIDLGKSGESIACKYLQTKGHTILELNFRFGRKEIDIISLDKDILVFTEIKTRRSHLFGFPEEAVTQRKQIFLKAVAEQYCLSQPQYAKIRFDIISLIIQSEMVKEIMHFEDAFY